MSRHNNRIRVGKINFTNVWPVFYDFPAEGLQSKVEIVPQVPTGLNAAMLGGTIDIAPISSFAYGDAFKNYLLYPDLSVSAYGRVNSILLFHKKRFEDVVNGIIALPTTSATSVNLFKIIVKKFYGGNPRCFYASPCLDDMLKTADAALLIGDDAIKAQWANRHYEVTDLGELWLRHTGRWMTFAVWAIRKQTADSEPEVVAEIYRAFQRSKAKGIEIPLPLVNEAMKGIGGTQQFWVDYFSNLCYDFGPEQWEGLQLYFQYALELGLIREEVPIQIWTDKTLAR